MTGKFGVRWCLGLLAASLAVIGALACADQQESCGRKDISRVVHKDGKTTYQRCEINDDGNLVWTNA